MTAAPARLAGVVAIGLCMLPAAGCGVGSAADSKPRLTVSAAKSLQPAFEDYGARFAPATARFSFSGSDQAAAQIRRGVRPDVYAAANRELPLTLFEEGLVERPVDFAANRIAIAIPEGSDIDGLDDLAAEGLDLAIGAETVPVGAYTRELFDRLPARRRRAILANVRSEEPDVSGVVAKVAQGAVDAGLVYATDVRAARQRMRAIRVPRRLQPRVTYAVAVVKDAGRPHAARAFVDGLLAGPGRRALADAGFEVP